MLTDKSHCHRKPRPPAGRGAAGAAVIALRFSGLIYRRDPEGVYVRMCAWNVFGRRAGSREQHELIKTIKNSDKGRKQAREQLRSMMESGDAQTLDQIAQARVQVYAQAAYEGDAQAQYKMGLSQAKLGNKEVSLEWLTGLAKAGDVKAMKAIARGYGPNGIYGYRREEYRHWTQKAAEAGDAQAQAELGRFYEGKNEKMSRYWYKQAAKQGWTAGCIGLGRSYYNEALQCFGEQEEDRRKEWMKRAEKCFLKAADCAEKEADFAGACHELGVLYETAAGGEDGAERAAYFYYQSWSTGKREEDLTAFGRIRDKYKLKINPADMDGWEERLFGGGKREEEKPGDVRTEGEE